MSIANDIWDRSEQRRQEGKALAKATEPVIRAQLHHMQANHFLRNMIKALEIHSWRNTVADWQRYYEAKYALKLRGRRR